MAELEHDLPDGSPKAMVTIGIKLRVAGKGTPWEELDDNIILSARSEKMIDTNIRNVIQALYPALAVCEVRWSFQDSYQGHYFEYRRNW